MSYHNRMRLRYPCGIAGSTSERALDVCRTACPTAGEVLTDTGPAPAPRAAGPAGLAATGGLGWPGGGRAGKSDRTSCQQAEQEHNQAVGKRQQHPRDTPSQAPDPAAKTPAQIAKPSFRAGRHAVGQLRAARQHTVIIADKAITNVVAYARIVLQAPPGSREAAVLEAMKTFCEAWAPTGPRSSTSRPPPTASYMCRSPMMPCLNETGRLLCQGAAPCLPLACRRHLVVIVRQELPFQKPVSATPVVVPNLPWVPTATQEVGERHPSPHREAPWPGGGLMAWTLHAEPFHDAHAACPCVQLLASGPTPPAAMQLVADVHDTWL